MSSDEIRRTNAKKSTGPSSTRGKQRARMNAVKHNLSGQNLILLESERVAYNRMAISMLSDLNPKTEPERQIAQKIIDTNFRLNRITAIESNMFSFGLLENERQNDSDNEIETMAAQTRAWISAPTPSTSLAATKPASPASYSNTRPNSSASRPSANPAQLKKKNKIPSTQLRLANSLPRSS